MRLWKAIMFQFYDSPIKSNCPVPRIRGDWHQFQFYDSPIKSYNEGSITFSAYSKFQFYDSPIKSFLFFIILSEIMGFNSMIVRLKVYWVQPRTITNEVFQFYDSPIKRLAGVLYPILDRRFQFYDSPIKRTVCATQLSIRTMCFNSMIVRLKVSIRLRIVTHSQSFNSMIVRLKGQ